MQNKMEDKINSVIQTTMQNLNALVDVNTIVGNPIKSDNGEYIIPVSKVTVGVLVGGGEYGKLGIFKKGSDLPYTAGNGAIVSIKPCAFLVCDEGKHKVLNISNSASEKFIEKVSDIISEIQAKEW